MDPTRQAPDVTDTIVALSSAPGASARAIVRLSGPGTIAIVSQMFHGGQGDVAARGLHTGYLQLPDLNHGLPADALTFVAPRSYTGQDLIELHVPGCMPLVDLLVEHLLSQGARRALPGEFTLRAFLAGKLDLTQVEAVIAVLQAQDRADLSQALEQLAGGVQKPLVTLREELLSLLADVEASLDFADEDIQIAGSAELQQRLAAISAHVALVLEQLRTRSTRTAPFRVVLTGRPNAGKSTLYNALLNRHAALTSPVPGTTRDYLRATVRRESTEIELVDTAGQRHGTDEIEAEAGRLGAEQKLAADLILECVALDTMEEPERGTENRVPTLRVFTKCDLAVAPSGVMAISALTGIRIDQLWSKLEEHAGKVVRCEAASATARSQHHLERAGEHLNAAMKVLDNREPIEMLAVELRAALEELGELTGVVFTNDLLDRIFSRFCIGK